MSGPERHSDPYIEHAENFADEPVSLVGEKKVIGGEDGFLLVRRLAVAAADAAHHLGDVAVGAIEWGTVLGAMPGDR